MPSTVHDDVDAIAQALIDAFDLTFEEAEAQLSDPLIRWLDYRLRYIDPTPRQTLKSADFDVRVPAEATAAITAFIALSEAGGDLNPYQTKRIKDNDSSGMKRQLRTDGLWADWGIHHAHLTETPLGSSGEFSARSEWLLFFLVLPEQLALIDVRPHAPGIFQAVDLIEKTIRSWPAYAERFALKGAVGLARSPSADVDAVRSLRTAGITQMLEVDGVVYMPPGLGVTSAATSTKVSLKRDRAKQLAREIEKFFAQAGGQPMMTVESKGVTAPTFSLRVLPTGRLAVVCPEAEMCWPFPPTPLQEDARSELESLLLPLWAGTKLVACSTTHQPTDSTAQA